MLVRIACWHWPCSWLCFSLSWWFNPPFPLKTNCNVSVLQMLRKTDRGICHPLQLQVSQFESKVHRLIPLIPTRSHCLQKALDYSVLAEEGQSGDGRQVPGCFSPACFPLLPLFFSPSWYEWLSPHFSHYGLRGCTNVFPVRMGWNPLKPWKLINLSSLKSFLPSVMITVTQKITNTKCYTLNVSDVSI